MELQGQSCTIPIGLTPLSNREIDALLLQVPGWSFEDKKIFREFKFKDFHHALDFVKKIAVIADEQNHHPDILISYNKVRLTLTTHKIAGLSLNDFIFAAKTNLLVDKLSEEAA